MVLSFTQWSQLVKTVGEKAYELIQERVCDNWKSYVDGDSVSVWGDTEFDKVFQQVVDTLSPEQKEFIKKDTAWNLLHKTSFEWINIQHPGWVNELEESVKSSAADDEYERNDAAYWDHVNQQIDERRGK